MSLGQNLPHVVPLVAPVVTFLTTKHYLVKRMNLKVYDLPVWVYRMLITASAYLGHQYHGTHQNG